jgi:hypothetical protein
MNSDRNDTQTFKQFCRQSPLKPAPQVSATTSAIIRLLEARPLMFWGGLWLVMVLVVAGAVSSLLSPGWGENQSAHTIANRRNRTTETQTVPEVAPPQIVATNALPKASPATATQSETPQYSLAWWFGAIFMSCVAGSIVLNQLLQRPRTMHRKVKPTTHRVIPRNQPSPKSPELPILINPVPTVAAPGIPIATKTPPPKPMKQRSMRYRNRRVAPPIKTVVPARPQKVTVSVVPAEERHPLDWQTSSLAESVDLRKRHSLSSWL